MCELRKLREYELVETKGQRTGGSGVFTSFRWAMPPG